MNREKLKRCRLNLGLTQQDVADRIGVKKPTYQRYESGVIKRIDTLTMEKLAKVLGCTPEYLLDWAEPTSDVDLLAEELHKRPELHLLFSKTVKATKEDIEQVIRIVDALKKGE